MFQIEKSHLENVRIDEKGNRFVTRLKNTRFLFDIIYSKYEHPNQQLYLSELFLTFPEVSETVYNGILRSFLPLSSMRVGVIHNPINPTGVSYLICSNTELLSYGQNASNDLFFDMNNGMTVISSRVLFNKQRTDRYEIPREYCPERFGRDNGHKLIVGADIKK